MEVSSICYSYSRDGEERDGRPFSDQPSDQDWPEALHGQGACNNSEYLIIILMPGPHAAPPLPSHHSPNHPEQVSSQVFP